MNLKNAKDLLLIQTARTMESINEAVTRGFKPLMKKVIPGRGVGSKYAVLQHKKSGKIEVIGDYRMLYRLEGVKEYEMVIDWTYYYPYTFPSPYAAYLLPKRLAKGERVFLEDLIEDIVGSRWNQGSGYRLESAEAIWNGTDFEVQFNPETDREYLIG